MEIFVKQTLLTLTDFSYLFIDLKAFNDTEEDFIKAFESINYYKRKAKKVLFNFIKYSPDFRNILESFENVIAMSKIDETAINNILDDKYFRTDEESNKSHDNINVVTDKEETLKSKYKAASFTNEIVSEAKENKEIHDIPEIINNSPINNIYKQKIIVKEKIKIAICGTEKRIGTTTQSLLITKFLKSLGFNSCYVEANKNRHIEKTIKYYDFSSNKNLGYINANGVDIYYKFDLPFLLTQDNNFYVIDYGLFNDIDYENFIMSDFKIIVCGAKAWELDNTTNILKDLYQIKDIHYIFSFIDNESEKQDIKNLMSTKNQYTYFSEYVCSPFDSINKNNEIYNQIFSDYISLNSNNFIDQEVKKKKTFLGGLFKK